jgi:lysyl-tRNA synthetase, class II
MFMTNQQSIQDVMFFPQMRPEVRQKAQGSRLREEFIEPGVSEDWVEPLMALGYDSVEKLKEVEKPGKLANDLNGFKKKNKLDLPGLSMEAVEEWLK